MGGIDRRIRELEEQFARVATHEPSESFTHLRAILDEFAALKQSCADRWTPEGTVPGENVPRKILGPGYTHAQLMGLAVSRAVDAGKVPAERAHGYLCHLNGMRGRGGGDPDAVVEWERDGA